MAIQSIKHGLPFPAWPVEGSGVPSLSNYLIDASGEKVAVVASATAAKSIRTIHFRTGTVTTGDTLDCRVETVDNAANGDPTGTLWATNTNGSCVVASSDDNVWKSATLTADATLAIGDVFAIVIVNGGGGGNLNIAGFADSAPLFPYGDHFTSAWAKVGAPPLIVAEYSDGSFEPIYGIADSGGPITTTTYNSGSTTNRRGNIFQLAFPSRAKGCWAWVDADGDFTVKVYDSAGTSVLATTATINNFQRLSNAGRIAFYPFLASVSLSAGTNYRIAVVPGTVTNLSTYEFDVPAAGMLDMFPGGQSCHASVFTSSAWVETTTRRGYLGLFLDGFDDGASAGGPVGKNMRGGFAN